MAAAPADLPPPPGFEGYAAEDFDEADLAEFQSFMGQQASSSRAPPRPEGGDAELAELQQFMRQRPQKPSAPPGAARGSGLVQESSSVVQISHWGGQGVALENDVIDADKKFEDLHLPDALLQGVYDMGFVKPSKIQAAALPRIAWKGGQVPGSNMIGQAQNGSGKTATFALALLTAIDVNQLQPQALVVCTTRELAKQNEAVISQLGKFMPVRTLLVCPQEHVPRGSPCHVLVGTPGKTWDLAKKRILDTSAIKVFVLDEADMMLDQEQQMGTQITQIRTFLPRDLQVLFFSATYPDDVRKFAEHLVPSAYSIKVSNTDLTVSTISQMYVRCRSEDEKFEKLNELYAAMNVSQSIVFVNARHKAFKLAQAMKDVGHTVSLICGTQQTGEERMDPALRDKVMHEFRTGITKVLISTDVLSRGIDVPQVTLVVNYELPGFRGDKKDYMETYLHRVGRTGRFGAKGVAVNLILHAEQAKVEEICAYFACRIVEMDTDFEALEKRLRELR